MTYNEADHPRDERGRWTSAGGGNEENSNDIPVLKGRIEKTEKSPAQILYGKLGNIKTKEKEESIYRNILLDTLGKLATPAVTLYSSIKQLEKMVKENKLEKELNKNIARKATGDFGFDKSFWNIPYYKKLSEEYNKELGDFLRKNTDNPDYYSNDLRHQYVSAIFARNLGEKAAKHMGNLNEITGGLSAPGDSDIDQINNEIGREYAKKYPNMPREELLKLMLKEHSKNQQIRIEKMKEKNKNNLDNEYM